MMSLRNIPDNPYSFSAPPDLLDSRTEPNLTWLYASELP